jgi:2-polyprenyl-3-methyl-5-hydroxy-6-metoxy-1,4-benzoquinol methylase
MTKVVESNGQGKLGKCGGCNVIYAYERPTLGVNNILYKYYLPSNLTDLPTRESQLESRPKELNGDLDHIESYIERGYLLDVGASSGDFLAYARVRGWKVEATELSELCADFMTRTLKIPVFIGNIEDIELEPEKYNVITLRHCVEHLRDPVVELKKLNTALVEEGMLFISTPEHAKDLELIKENHMLPLHLVNYTKDTLDFLLLKTGFKMLSYESLDSESEIKNMRVMAMKVE